ncbi:MAG: SCO family protein [Candidatus Hydrogenedentes bacterium]|nr:SCO family protein [Candidatus Hydrogenedentota bacterium]
MRSLMALAIALGTGAGASAQEAAKGEVKDYELDPIGFRGPNPAGRFEDIKIQQNLGMQVPMDLMFRDEKDQPVRLGDLFGGEPVVLSLVYYGCPMLCTLVLNGMVSGIDGQPEDFQLGRDYKVITVSIDPNERGDLATEKKTNYLDMLQQENAPEHWRFLTGDKEQIETLAETVGFRYYYDETTKQYAHDSGIMILTPKGKVSSYYLGIEYIPQNLRTALEIAGVETIGQYLKQPSLLCYYYDPTHGTYGLMIMSAVRLGGMATVAALVAFWVVNYVRAGRARKLSMGLDAQTPTPAGLSGSV